MKNEILEITQEEFANYVETYRRAYDVSQNRVEHIKLKRGIEKSLKVDPRITDTFNEYELSLNLSYDQTGEELDPRPNWAYWFVSKAIDRKVNISEINDFFKRLQVDIVLKRELTPKIFSVFSHGRTIGTVHASNRGTRINVECTCGCALCVTY